MRLTTLLHHLMVSCVIDPHVKGTEYSNHYRSLSPLETKPMTIRKMGLRAMMTIAGGLRYQVPAILAEGA